MTLKLMRFAWWFPAVIFMLGVVFMSAPPAYAQEERETVRIDGRTLFRVGESSETAARERARSIERRLATLLENPAAIVAARIEKAGANDAERILSIAGVPVVTVTQADAQDNLTSTDTLAAQ